MIYFFLQCLAVDRHLWEMIKDRLRVNQVCFMCIGLYSETWQNLHSKIEWPLPGGL